MINQHFVELNLHDLEEVSGGGLLNGLSAIAAGAAAGIYGSIKLYAVATGAKTTLVGVAASAGVVGLVGGAAVVGGVALIAYGVYTSVK